MGKRSVSSSVPTSYLEHLGHEPKERASWLAPSWFLLDSGPGGLPTWSLLCWLVTDDDGVALVAAGVEVAGGDGPAVGFRGGNSAVAGRCVATVPDDPA